jgi:hypothetical protein
MNTRIVFAGLLAVLAFDCSSPPPTSNAPKTCNVSATATACDACEFNNCCDQFTTCQENSACASIGQCVQACSSQSCIDDCESQYPGGASDFSTFSNCLIAFCSSCASSPGGSSGSSSSTPTPPSGTYQRTCTGCSVNGSLLTCLSCPDDQGLDHDSSLSLPCSGDIANCLGQLTCGGCSSGSSSSCTSFPGTGNSYDAECSKDGNPPNYYTQCTSAPFAGCVSYTKYMPDAYCCP